MIAGGWAASAPAQTHKLPFGAGTLLVQLGGPGMRIGMGGGAASSMAAGTNTAALDFDSVQRGNPEIQRRAQEVINHCWALGETTRSWPSTTWAPAASATPSPNWWTARARAPPSTCAGAAGRSGLAPKEIWCNESQERYVLAVNPDLLPLFEQMCERERCPFAVVGVATDAPQLVLEDGPGGERAIDMPMDVLLGKPPKMHRDVQRVRAHRAAAGPDRREAGEVAFDVLRHPTVASKRFLITIGDRTVGGLNHRDPMVGPWQVPVADCAVTLADYAACAARRWHGRAHAAGRAGRAGLGPHGGGRGHHQPAGRADRAVARQAQLQLDGRLRRAGRRRGAVRHRARPWAGAVPGAGHRRAGGQGFAVDAHALVRRRRAKQVTAPVSLIVTAFATLDDVRGTLTPQLQPGDTTLILVDLGQGRAHGRLDAGAGAGPVR
jgi:phosphoribosylformylglycinamidine synthase